MTASTIPCLLCGKTAHTKHTAHPSYQKPHIHGIHHCSQCNTAFVTPCEVDQQVYNLIYQKIGEVPGYDRYLNYADRVLKEEDPLKYLCEAEDIYWSVREALKLCPTNNPKILELGSGFGYLTYALHKSGYDIKGLEISSVAVEEATRRYGDLFICGDAFEFSQKSGSIYDVVILTEVIEHVPNPQALLSAIDAMLKPGGKVIITTPNKTPYPSDILWETEPPPIHLWWFSEQSMAFFAKLLGYQCSFIDFTEFSIRELNLFKDYQKPYTVINQYQPSRLPRFDEKGKVLGFPVVVYLAEYKPYLSIRKQLKFCLNILGLLNILRKLKILYRDRVRIPRLIRSLKKTPHKRPVLCAVFYKPPQ